VRLLIGIIRGMRSALLLILVLGCESKIDKLDKAIDKMEDKVKNNTAVQKVDKGLDKLDTDEASDHLTKAKEMVAKGEEPMEACSWVDRAASSAQDKVPVKELQKLCQVDVPLTKATKAVVAAEKAKVEQPSAPSYTECSSDDWAAMKTKLEGTGDARWSDLKVRWAKVCP
jgi:hypothetical protein